tara:strand:- start:116 stop:454 length:339 start_codon:yes stop_codon:yes gene_type:complete
MFRVVDGADEGKTFWDNWNLTNQYPKIDAKTFHYLDLIGLNIDILDQDDLSDEQLSEIVVQHRAVVKVKAKYKQDKNDPAKLWPDHIYEASESGNKVVSSADAPVVEDDFDF